MGAKLSRKKAPCVLVFGLKGSGKTTLAATMRKAASPESVAGHSAPLHLFEGVRFQFVTPGDDLEAVGREGFSALVLMVDGNDLSRLQEHKKPLTELLTTDSIMGLPLCVASNKADLKGGAHVGEVCDGLELATRITGKQRWYISSCSALTGEGLSSLCEWLKSAVD
eukprot:Amastigsp_a340678_15.p1 type:complete len:167 gc:universal Amastigsp_a340678_15:76-576(+)